MQHSNNKKSVTLRFVLYVVYRVLTLPSVRTSTTNIQLSGLTVRHLRSVDALYADLNKNKHLGLVKYVFYALFGEKTAIVAFENDRIIGFELYSFGVRDYYDRSIHQTFTGVARHCQGRGIATAIRRHAIQHFSKTTLRGISSRVSVTNEASLRSNEKIGFRHIERYFDASMNEERFYLLCKLDRFREP